MRFFILFFAISLISSANAVNKVKGVDVNVDDVAKVMVNMEPIIKPDVFTLDKPLRIVFDFKDSLLLCGAQNINVGKKGLLSLRVAQYMSKYLKEPENIVRIVFDVEELAPYRIEEKDSHLLIEFGKMDEEKPKKVEAKRAEIISLEFVNTPIDDVLRVISYKVGVNIIPSADVKGEVTARLRDVHWKVGLEAVLGSIGLGFIEEDGIIRVDTIEKIQKQEIKTRVFTLNYISAERVKEAIHPVLTPEVGKVSFDAATNSLIVSDNVVALQKVKSIIESLDKKTPQVLIEAKLVKLSEEASREIGSEWFFDDIHWRGTIEEQQTEGHRHGEADSHPHGRGIGFSPTPGRILKEPWVHPKGGWLRVGILERGKYFLDATLSMLISQRKAELLASPKVIALNGQEAKIVVGDRVPYTTVVKTEVGIIEEVEFEEIGIRLLVTPTVSPDGYINLRIHPEISTIKGYTPKDLPIKDTCEADCQVLVKSGQTVVVGGLIREEEIKSEDKFPILGDLPIIGYLFKKEKKTKDKKEIIIIITPTLLSV